METRSFKRKRALKELAENSIKEEDDDDDEGGISNLPDDVLHRILSLLPIKHIAQSSILSKRWRHLWKSIPDLDFTTVAPLSAAASMAVGKKRLHAPPPHKDSDFLSNVLTLRDKTNSDVRLLRVSAHLSFTHLSRLVRLALKRNVQELDIEVATTDLFRLPRPILWSQSLRVFRLKSCFPGFSLPPSSVMSCGFRTLHTLSLSLVILYDQPRLVDMFTDSSFPLLRRLSLDACFGLQCLKTLLSLHILNTPPQVSLHILNTNCFQLDELEVHCQTLTKVRIVSCFDAYSDYSRFKIAAPKLKAMSWEYNALIDKYEMEDLSSLDEASVEFIVAGDGISTDKLLGAGDLISGLSHTNSLTLRTQCVEVLSSKKQLVAPIAFARLNSLELHTGFDRRNVTALAQLLKGSPSLQMLIIYIINSYKTDRNDDWNRESWETDTTEGKRFWESQSEGLNPVLGSLKEVKMHGVSVCENEISLARFLLTHGRALEEMVICFAKRGLKKDSLRLQRNKIKSQMMGFSWASSNAKITFL